MLCSSTFNSKVLVPLPKLYFALPLLLFSLISTTLTSVSPCRTPFLNCIFSWGFPCFLVSIFFYLFFMFHVTAAICHGDGLHFLFVSRFPHDLEIL